MSRSDLLACLILAALPLFSQSSPLASSKDGGKSGSPANSKPALKQPTPTVFQADEGDHWMLLGDKPLIFKVDPLSTGSDTLVVGTEEMPPGNRIPTHKHLYEDEVLFRTQRRRTRHSRWPSIRRRDRGYSVRPSRKLDWRRQYFERVRNDSFLLQQARVRAMPASHVFAPGREIYDAFSGEDEGRSRRMPRSNGESGEMKRRKSLP